LLFQTGETAYAKTIVDGQHPHNFIMSLGFHYAYQLSENTTLSAYFAPVGDPAPRSTRPFPAGSRNASPDGQERS
jgi:hypothetical protein